MEALTETSDQVGDVERQTEYALDSSHTPKKSRCLRQRKSSMIKRLEIEVKTKITRTKAKQSKKKRVDSQLLRDCALTSSSDKTAEKKKRRRREGRKKKVVAKKQEKVKARWTHYSKQDLRDKFGNQMRDKNIDNPSSWLYTFPPSQSPSYISPLTTFPSPPPSKSSPTITTFLCQKPTTVAPTLSCKASVSPPTNLPPSPNHLPPNSTPA